MARIFTSGFELNSLTAGVEFDAATVAGVSIQNTTKRTGGYALKWLAGSGQAYVVRNIPTMGSGRTYYARTYFMYHTLTAGISEPFMWFESGAWPAEGLMVAITTAGKLQLLSFNDGRQFGSDSAALSADTWYCVEISYTYTTGAVALRINGSSITSGTLNTSLGMLRMDIGGVWGNSAGEYYFDDVALNDDQGSYQNSWPGLGKVLQLRPSATGESAQWARGGTDSGANWSQCNNIPPNDHTSYISVSTVNYLDMYNVDSPGLAAGSTINVVEVGGRFARSASVSPGIKFRLVKAASGTESLSAEITPDNTQPTYKSNALASPWTSPIITYLDPDGSAWTPTTIDSMQIGVKEITDTNRTVYVSDIWAIVDYSESTGRTGTVAGVCAQVTGAVAGDVLVSGDVAGTAAQVTGAVASKVAVAGAVAAIAAQATAAVAMNHTPATGSVDADVAAVTGVVAGAVLVTGEVAATPGVTTGALAGAVLVSGEIAATAAQVTAAVDGSVGAGAITGTVEAVAAQTIAALAGAVAIAGEIAATLAPVTGAVAGGAIVSGTVAANALQTTAAVAGAARVSGSVSAPVAQTTGAVAGAVAITGDVDATASQVTAVLSGGTADVIRGTIAANVSQIVAAIEGDVLVSGSVNATLVAASAAAAGTVTDAPAEDLNVYIRVPGREVVNYYHRVDNVRITVP